MATPEEKIFANALNQLPELGAVRLNQLYKYFGSWTKAWEAHPTEYLKAGMAQQPIDRIIPNKPKINPEHSYQELLDRGIEVILHTDSDYPELLREIAAAPPILYIRGQKSALRKTGLAVVGTRKVSGYGRRVCHELVAGLAQNNLAVVSGLAFGVDAEALEACVANDGIAIGVLASDLADGSISPRRNFQLAQKIMDKGCLVSEYALGASVFKQNFPIRNRIISGLALGTIVIEADIESGSLITVNYALEQNREVFAVPGSIFSEVSRGTNELLRKGAHVVTGIGSILDELKLTGTPLESSTSETEITDEERKILEQLKRGESLHIAQLMRQVPLVPAVINSNLTMLEMKGRVKNLGNGHYVKIR